MLAQTGAVCALSLPENKGKIAYFAGIDKATLPQARLLPGDTLTPGGGNDQGTAGTVGGRQRLWRTRGQAKRSSPAELTSDAMGDRALKRESAGDGRKSRMFKKVPDCQPRRDRGADYPRLPGAGGAHGGGVLRGRPGVALHAQIADEAVCIGPASSKDSYLNIKSILAACEAHRRRGRPSRASDFLSENAAFARMCARCGVAFIGPSPAGHRR